MNERAFELMAQAIEHASAAATDPSQWTLLVADINELFGARNTVLFTPEPASGLQPLGRAHGDLAYGIDEYFSHWAYDDAWLNAVAGTSFFQKAGEARFSQEFLEDIELRKTAFFNDWARHYSSERSLALKVTDGSDVHAPVMHLTLFRNLADAPFTTHDRTLLRVLWPHLKNAARSHWILQPLRQESHAIESTLNILSTPTWVVCEDFSVEFANTAAIELMRSGTWARKRNGQLHTMGNLDRESLRNRCRNGEQVFIVSGAQNGQLQRAIVRFIPITETALYASLWPRAYGLIMLEIASLPTYNSLWLSHLAERFNLTPAQRVILESLSRGLCVDEIARVHGIKVGTVRSHLHELLSKTGQINQTGLVRLALGM